MTMVPVKISQPSLPWVVQRKKLARLVDTKLAKPVVWISAPAGAGKTTFVSSYLAARNMPCLWYRCDEGDADPAAFFYYMGLAAKNAAPRRRKSLPLLTPDHQPSTEAFARVYFDQLYSFMATRGATGGKPSGWVMVLDNYQDVPPDSPLHQLIAIGLSMIPGGVHAFVISRSAPPQAMARLQARDRLASVHPMDLRFSYDESRELMRKRMPGIDPSAIKSMHEKTQGWVAGITLMLEGERMGADVTASAALFAHEKVFDYFAAEILSRTEARVQDFLLKTAYLPVFNAVTAGALTGLPKVADILATMGRHHFFTEQVSENRREYRFHPLFRDFLLSTSRDRFSARQLALIRKRAADILERSGHIEEAAKLFRNAADARNLSRLVIDHAREYLQQGRRKTLQEWIAGIPPTTVADHPWLLYWTGMCAFPLDMPRAGKYLQMAFDRFQAAGDPAGIYLSWAGVVDTYAFDLGEWKRLDTCIAVFDGLRKQFPDFPSPDIDLAASSRMLISLTLRKTDQPERVQAWLNRIARLLEENPSLDIQWDVYFCMSLYYLWKGEYHKNTVLLEKAAAQMRGRQIMPFAQIRIKLMQGIHYWVTARYDAALDTLSQGMRISAKTGVHVFDSMLWSFTAAAQMASGNVAGAKRSLGHQMEALLETNKPLDLFFYHVNAAWYAVLKQNPSLARDHLESISAKATKMGTPYYQALWHIGMAQVSILQDRSRSARPHIRKALRISLEMKSRVMEWYGLLIEAWLHFSAHQEQKGVVSLRRALELSQDQGYVHLEFFQPAVMQYLLAQALAHGLAPDHVKSLIKQLGLAPPDPGEEGAPHAGLENWPYPFQVYTLGRFEIVRNDEPLVFTGKTQKKPLDLFKAIIAFGGRDVPAQRLADALWPDADGDLARKSLETTLGRLRRLLGADHLIRYAAGQLSLDPQAVRVDSLALVDLLDGIRQMPDQHAGRLCREVIALYKGLFLPSDTDASWTVSTREMLKNRMLGVITSAGRYEEKAGRWERAAEYYLQGLEVDSLAESFYQRLLVCYGKLGRFADAAQTYNRCCMQLQRRLGVKPSAATQRLYTTTLRNP